MNGAEIVLTLHKIDNSSQQVIHQAGNIYSEFLILFSFLAAVLIAVIPIAILMVAGGEQID